SSADLDNSAYSWSYGYDSLDRLTSAVTSSQSLGWTYDANGNRLSQTGVQQAYQYTYNSTNNQFVTGDNNPVGAYDAAGNGLAATGRDIRYDSEGNVSNYETIWRPNGLRQDVSWLQYYWQGRFVYDDAGHPIGEYEYDPDDWSPALQPLQETIYL